MIKRVTPRLFVLGFLFLAACAPTIEQQISQKGKSVVIASIQLEPDTEKSFLQVPASNVYRMSIRIAGDEEDRASTARHQDRDTDTTWLALALDPGTYFLRSVTENAVDELFSFGRDTKITNFIDVARKTENGKSTAVVSDLTPTFVVREGETLYIGSFRAELKMESGAFAARWVGEAVKRYSLEPTRAREALTKFRFSSGEFREVDIFAGKPEALAKLQKPWTARADIE
ncbi:MAG: hypothetical protein HOL07_00280 [Rhodospirillaceae bacterium]|jgi:hypothetical protein|nr:hypothetical protein [Rhodospirillaceae bacterium]MBT3808369.1 hypothetical protein [Rhodospirillaceae bacterium]MBT3930395.1 hypothetical protein [Rhodospirillaceae bacterium]MBT4771459.1 hypothetical protein [Rhodospirillaceae bacterium]MBT5356758.1 hypothetical protein [Rhodospirillaceae bacterium]